MTLQEVIAGYRISLNATAESPRAHSCSFYADVIRESCKRKNTSFVRNIDNPGGVLRLLLRSSPSAISRFIITIAIYSINGCSLRPRAHIPQKTLKTIKPLWTYLNAFSSPQGVISLVGIKASGPHRGPRSILRSALAAGVAMSAFCRSKSFASDTSTPFGMTFPEITGANNRATTAITSAIPANFIASIRGLTLYRQSSIFLADKVNLFHKRLLARNLMT